MSARTATPVLAALTLAALLMLSSTWDGPAAAVPTAAGIEGTTEEIRELLQGTWVREYSGEGARVRRVLSLEPAGAFRESARIEDASGKVTEFVHEGIWLYDGTNLKRRYTLMNGQPPSRLKAPFATFQITFRSRNDFVGVDHVHGHRVEYRRIRYDASP